MRYAMTMAVVMVLVGWASSAGATVGGPSTITPIGFDRADHKVYLLEEFHDEGERLPQVHYTFTEGEHVGRVFRVCSWYRDVPLWMMAEGCAHLGRHAGDGQAAENALMAKLAELRGRLEPMTAAPRHDLAFETQALGQVRRRDPQIHEHTWVGTRQRVTVYPKGERAMRRATTVTVFGVANREDPLRVHQLWPIAPGLGLAVLRYVGIPYEIGYTKDTALVVRLAP